MDVGLHCSITACNQVDFLPFTCDCCRSVFCLAHRTYDAHECPLAGSKDRRVIECPLCQQMLHWTSEQDVNIVWERHVQGGECVPKHGVDATGAPKKAKKPKKPRCSAANCRDILTASNQFQCVKCHQNVCLKHRFESDHDCETVRRSQQRQWGFARPATSATARAPAAASRRSAADASQLQQSARTVATSVVNGTKSAARSLVQNAKAASATVSAAAASTSASLITTASEECPMCQKRFAYVSQLIAHVNHAHPDASSRGASSAQPIDLMTAAASSSSASGREVCPQCRAEFRDVGALIQHAETTHASGVAAGGSSASRRASGATDQDKCNLM